MSVATSPTQTLASSEYATKNTFIHIPDGVDVKSRRPQSLPPAMRFNRDTTDGNLCEGSFSEVEISTNCTDDDISSVTGSSEHGNLSEETITPAKTFDQPFVETLVPHTSAMRLNTFAKPWSPCGQMLPPQVARMFAHQLEKVITITKGTLAACVWIQSLELQDEGKAGWSIVARMLPTDFPYKDHVLTLAKGALMHAAGSVTKVCIVGRHASPFVTMPLGVAALFAGVLDGQSTCWSLLQKGCCPYGDRCRWEHPVYRRKVYVKVMLPDVQ
jgi:hypothetical protein